MNEATALQELFKDQAVFLGQVRELVNAAFDAIHHPNALSMIDLAVALKPFHEMIQDRT